MIDLNDTAPCYMGSKHNNKAHTDLLFAAWCALTVLDKQRSTFEGLVSGLMEDGKKVLRRKIAYSQDVSYPAICSTGGVLVITHCKVEPGSITYQHEVCITCCHKYNDP